MRVLVAIDSFKGSLSSLQAGNAVKDAVHLLDQNTSVTVRPLADGGEGTVEAMSCTGGKLVTATVSDPLGRPIEAQYCITHETAVIEMSAAAGITLIKAEERDPYRTTTYGVGQLIKDAIEHGCSHFIVGIGGSATNDGGTGMLSALGFRFLDSSGAPISLGAAGLQQLAAIDITGALPQLQQCSFRVACDVTILCVVKGAAARSTALRRAQHRNLSKRWICGYSDSRSLPHRFLRNLIPTILAAVQQAAWASASGRS